MVSVFDQLNNPQLDNTPGIMTQVAPIVETHKKEKCACQEHAKLELLMNRLQLVLVILLIIIAIITIMQKIYK